MTIVDKKAGQNSPKNFYCDVCDYTCSKASHFKQHLSTAKHKNQHLSTFINKKGKIVPELFRCECGKTYKGRDGLWRHKKVCLSTPVNELSTTHFSCDCGQLFKNVQDYKLHMNSCSKNVNNEIFKTMVKALSSVTSSKDEMKEMVTSMIKDNQELHKNFIDNIPNMTGTVTNSHNTYHTNNISNNFNIQMFLNTHCKNAMNLTDFIETLPITNETYDNTIENGLTKTITTMFVDGLKNLDLLERPIHCTDPNRKTLYIKENDVWEKDNELKSIESGIKKIALKQRTSINKWQDANIGWDKDENLQTRMTKLVFNSMTSIEEDEKETNKIIKAIGKNTYLTNEIKDEYK